MALNLRNRETEKLVREYARRRGLGLTEAVHEAVREGLAREDARECLWERTADLRDRLEKFPPTGEVADKRFYDSLSGQDD
jgi:antitoxin VapB